MRLERVRLADFRNYVTLDVAPEPGLNVFVGPNAQGKSNLLEALAMLATGKSFRAHRESELIRADCERAEIAGDARISAGAIRLRCSIARTPAGMRKAFEVNGGAVGFARFLGRTRVVTFVPADLQLVSGGPALRRTLLNGALAQLSPTYYRDLALYQKIVQQKSALLHGAIAPDRDLLLAYNDELVRPAAALIAARRAFVDEIAAATVEIYARWRGADERLGVTYAPNPDGDVGEALAAAVESELRRRTTLVGPHRDDIRLLVDGKALSAFGSQGQQRTAVLALKVAEYEVMRTRTGDAPILLLDDVLSELDAERASGFLGAVGGYEQAFLTATDLPQAIGPAAVWAIRAAAVTRC
ncbi:DNA replication and repair protein RecF [Vulcanimicrobium alpinum]|uniref:DNA replication and repair protein RecF n=1 Tax=Vulcanimicrobium alpinum TaxID=3016050 RepID=A0AAN1XRR6_UNVUL|nr:DNA replication and repair protein RecF [Vulcanimicrobium alpinum]BDE04726.1 DNA replication and repair protein RecF [Vulcanimicrobium alpinum]